MLRWQVAKQAAEVVRSAPLLSELLSLGTRHGVDAWLVQATFVHAMLLAQQTHANAATVRDMVQPLLPALVQRPAKFLALLGNSTFVELPATSHAHVALTLELMAEAWDATQSKGVMSDMEARGVALRTASRFVLRSKLVVPNIDVKMFVAYTVRDTLVAAGAPASPSMLPANTYQQRLAELYANVTPVNVEELAELVESLPCPDSSTGTGSGLPLAISQSTVYLALICRLLCGEAASEMAASLSASLGLPHEMGLCIAKLVPDHTLALASWLVNGDPAPFPGLGHAPAAGPARAAAVAALASTVDGLGKPVMLPGEADHEPGWGLSAGQDTQSLLVLLQHEASAVSMLDRLRSRCRFEPAQQAVVEAALHQSGPRTQDVVADSLSGCLRVLVSRGCDVLQLQELACIVIGSGGADDNAVPPDAGCGGSAAIAAAVGYVINSAVEEVVASAVTNSLDGLVGSLQAKWVPPDDSRAPDSAGFVAPMRDAAWGAIEVALLASCTAAKPLNAGLVKVAASLLVLNDDDAAR